MELVNAVVREFVLGAGLDPTSQSSGCGGASKSSAAQRGPSRIIVPSAHEFLNSERDVRRPGWKKDEHNGTVNGDDVLAVSGGKTQQRLVITLRISDNFVPYVREPPVTLFVLPEQAICLHAYVWLSVWSERFSRDETAVRRFVERVILLNMDGIEFSICGLCLARAMLIARQTIRGVSDWNFCAATSHWRAVECLLSAVVDPRF